MNADPAPARAPYFSVLTPSYNQGAYLGDTIRSVLAQEDHDFEHLVFDNCSTDATPEVLRKHPHVRAVAESDRGQSEALNKGLRAARGEIICWLNADDQYPPGTFAALRAAFADPQKDVVFGDVEQVPFDGGARQRSRACWPERRDLARWWTSRARIHQPAVFFRRRVVEKTGLLREDLHLAMDYEYWWRMSEHFPFHYLDRVLAIQLRQPESKTVLAWYRVYDERRKIFGSAPAGLGENPLALACERRLAMSRRYRDAARAASLTDRRACARLLAQSLRENPLSAFSPTWLGAAARLAGGRAADRLIRRLRGEK